MLARTACADILNAWSVPKPAAAVRVDLDPEVTSPALDGRRPVALAQAAVVTTEIRECRRAGRRDPVGVGPGPFGAIQQGLQDTVRVYRVFESQAARAGRTGERFRHYVVLECGIRLQRSTCLLRALTKGQPTF